jgi:hypothetical protein
VTAAGRFAYWQLSWGLVAVLVAAGAAASLRNPVYAAELTFLVWFVGFLVGVELFAPRHVEPARWSRVRWVVFGGLFVTLLVVGRQAVPALP